MHSARTVFCILAALAAAGPALADGTVTLDLTSTMNGLTVAPGLGLWLSCRLCRGPGVGVRRIEFLGPVLDLKADQIDS